MSMPDIKRVLLVGANGRLGSHILDALVQLRYEVHVLTRLESDAISGGPGTSDVRVHRCIYDLERLTALLSEEHIDAVISAVSAMPDALAAQDLIRQAALASGTVKLFIPSEFGLDDADLAVREMTQGMFDAKYAHITRLKETEGRMDWVGVVNGAFFDMCMNDGELDVYPEQRRMVMYDDGNTPFSVSTLPFVGRAVVALIDQYIRSAETVRNRFVYIAQATITQNELLRLVQQRTGRGGKEWTVIRQTSDALMTEGCTALREGRIMDAIKPLCFVTAYKGLMDLRQKGCGRLDNGLLGLHEDDVEGAMVLATRDW